MKAKDPPVRLLLAIAKMETIALLLAFMTLLAANMEAGAQERLATCRQQIDSLDQRLVELIQERARVVQEVGAVKREGHLPVTDTSREQQVIRVRFRYGSHLCLPRLQVTACAVARSVDYMSFMLFCMANSFHLARTPKLCSAHSKRPVVQLS